MTNFTSKFFLAPTRFQYVKETVIGQDNYTQSSFSGNSIKLLSWNIAKNNYQRTWAKDFLSILEKHQPDLVCLQEVSLNKNTKVVLNLEIMGWDFAPNFFNAIAHNYYGILTASHVRSLTRKSLLTQSFEPFTNTPKVSLITEYSLSVSNQKLIVVNTHAINFVELAKFAMQLQQIEEFVSKQDEAIMLVGDFNTWNQRRLNLLNQMAARLGLIKTFFTPKDRRKIKSFLLSPPLDHIYYRGIKIKKQSATVLDWAYSSDHKPLFVEFSFSK